MLRADCEWGPVGARRLAGSAEVLIVVDVLSFSTCIDVAVARGAMVHPFPYGDRAAAAAAAEAIGAELAGPRGSPDHRYSLSPASLAAIPGGSRLLLPSPNGSAISAAAGATPTLAGCLRNARAVAARAAALAHGGTVAVIPAGERWPDGSLRPAIEDLIGAGAILHALAATAPDAELSPEAGIACAAWRHAQPRLDLIVRASVSGRELIDRGYPEDVEMALALGCSAVAPLLRDGAYCA